MQRTPTVLVVVAAALGLAACAETYTNVNAHQVIVRDSGDKVNRHNEVSACKHIGQKFVRAERTTDTVSLVTCSD